jgi:polyferredoxin
MGATNKQKKNINNEGTKKKHNGMASGLALATLGLFILLNQEIFRDHEIEIFNAIAIFISGLGFSVFVFAASDKLKDSFGSAIFLLAVYAPIYYLNFAYQWHTIVTLIINLVGLIIVFFSAGLFWYGVITIVTSIGKLVSKNENETDRQTAKKSLLTSIIQVGSLLLLVLQIIIAFSSVMA